MENSGKPILVVEDEPQVRTLIQTMLKAAGYGVVLAKDGTAAFRELRKRGGEFSLVLTDYDMGRMNGKELAESVRADYPALPILFVSGLPVGAIDVEQIAPGALLVTKPFDAATILHAVEKLALRSS